MGLWTCLPNPVADRLSHFAAATEHALIHDCDLYPPSAGSGVRLHRRQPLFSFINEGVNLLHVVATPPGHPEPPVAGLIGLERGCLTPRNVSRISCRNASTSAVS